MTNTNLDDLKEYAAYPIGSIDCYLDLAALAWEIPSPRHSRLARTAWDCLSIDQRLSLRADGSDPELP